MARPIALEFSARDPAAELRSKLENAPAEHAEALLAAYEVLQAMHDQGVLDILRGALDARDELIESAVTTVNTPESIRAIRNLVFCGRILASIEPEWLKRIFQAVPGVAQATSERDKPLGLWGLWRRLLSKDSLHGMAAAVDFLEAFGRHLHSLEPAPRSQEKN